MNCSTPTPGVHPNSCPSSRWCHPASHPLSSPSPAPSPSQHQSLFHSIAFLYFFALITEEVFLISSCYFLELCIQMDICFLFSLPLASLLFSAICNASSDNHFAFLHFFFLGMVLVTASCTMSWTSVHSYSGTLSIRSNHLNLFLISTV